MSILNTIPQVDLGADESMLMDRLVQWEQKVAEFEHLSREDLPDIIKRAIITEREPSAVRTHLVNAQSVATYALVRAAVESFVTAGRRWGLLDPRLPRRQEQGQGRRRQGQQGQG